MTKHLVSFSLENHIILIFFQNVLMAWCWSTRCPMLLVGSSGDSRRETFDTWDREEWRRFLLFWHFAVFVFFVGFVFVLECRVYKSFICDQSFKLSFCPSFCPSFCLSFCPSLCPNFCPSFYPRFCPSFCTKFCSSLTSKL